MENMDFLPVSRDEMIERAGLRPRLSFAVAQAFAGRGGSRGSGRAGRAFACRGFGAGAARLHPREALPHGRGLGCGSRHRAFGTHFMTAEEAKAFGLIDRVLEHH